MWYPKIIKKGSLAIVRRFPNGRRRKGRSTTLKMFNTLRKSFLVSTRDYEATISIFLNFLIFYCCPIMIIINFGFLIACFWWTSSLIMLLEFCATLDFLLVWVCYPWTRAFFFEWYDWYQRGTYNLLQWLTNLIYFHSKNCYTHRVCTERVGVSRVGPSGAEWWWIVRAHLDTKYYVSF